MRVLVIGGTRYFGRILVERLLEEGHAVSLFTRGRTRPAFWDRIEHLPGDRTDGAAFHAALAGREWDVVFDQQAYRREDVERARDALEGRVGRYVMTSTGSTYHDGYVDFLNTCPFPESALDHSRVSWKYPPGESEYGAGKRHCEKFLVEHAGFPSAVVRVPAVMGPDDPTGRMWFFVQRALDGGPLLWPAEEQAPWRTLYSGDAASALWGAARSPVARNEIYHVAMEEILTPRRWAGEIWRAAGAEADVVFVPKAALARLLPDSLPPFARDTPYIQDLRKSRDHLGFHSTPFPEWVAAAVRWYREEYRGGDSKGYACREREVRLAERWREASAELAASLCLDT